MDDPKFPNSHSSDFLNLMHATIFWNFSPATSTAHQDIQNSISDNQINFVKVYSNDTVSIDR